MLIGDCAIPGCKPEFGYNFTTYTHLFKHFLYRDPELSQNEFRGKPGRGPVPSRYATAYPE